MSGRKRARKERRRESRSVQRSLKKAGVKARLEHIRFVLREPKFHVDFNRALAWKEVVPTVANTDQIRDIALAVLRETREIDTTGINLIILWRPNEARALDLWASLTPDVAQAILEATKAAAQAALEAARAADQEAPL